MENMGQGVTHAHHPANAFHDGLSGSATRTMGLSPLSTEGISQFQRATLTNGLTPADDLGLHGLAHGVVPALWLLRRSMCRHPPNC